MRKERIDQLADLEDRWEDPAFVESQARARFGWVMPGEVGYRVIGADGQVKGDVTELAAPPKARKESWYGSLWDSTREAGQPDKPREAPEKPDEVLK